jgi:hypothetical protein
MRQLLPLPGRLKTPFQDHPDQGPIKVMGFCGSCHHNAMPTPPAAPLFQIKRGFRARWDVIDFKVESESDQWTLRVEDSISKETLYTAHRGGSGAAKSGALDFASFRLVCEGHVRPELQWQAYW